MGPTGGILAGAGLLAASGGEGSSGLLPVGLCLLAGGLTAAELDNPVSAVVSLAAVVTSGLAGATVMSQLGGELVGSSTARAELKESLGG